MDQKSPPSVSGLEPSETRARGVADHKAAVEWLKARGIQDVECIVPDQAGVARGKLMPTEKFARSPSITMPTSIFAQTIAGDYPPEDGEFVYDPTDGDLIFDPDYSTLAIVPWASDPAAQLIHDARHKDGRPVDHAPRNVLKRVVELYERKGLRPVVAPEIEFYLVKPNTDPDYPLEPPIGRSGRPEIGRQSFSIAAVNEFDDLFDDIYDYAEAQGLEIDTLIHEEGAAQMEINLLHGDAVDLADQVFLFKRTLREAALRHKMYATFMAKPMSGEPGSAMHIHASLVDHESGKTIFSDDEGNPTKEFFYFIAGHQKYLPAVMCILAPYVNSYRRLERFSASPTNVSWGYDNRTVGLRVPHGPPAARRLENRIPSSDANPYLAVAASLACGLLGLEEGQHPDDPIDGSASSLPFGLPRDLLNAVTLFEECEPLSDIFGKSFVSTFRAIKQAEYETYMRVISPWEREYLLLNV
ncbi:glutamine synthetase family protein [Acuticoccus sp. I52.16.1]|uniref:glutamine synthetase family protein n=1 Tax=Acuticoccus sp. I52.16.1 TaxID=2928472 RepID=UPI001FD3863B|nr:glutamine synthetase family protein [Acuticoccus sp. I52.16.1]UOM36214.1 glutamine synthetase family protein [Acuticoccus sp. I52.16.1]